VRAFLWPDLSRRLPVVGSPSGDASPIETSPNWIQFVTFRHRPATTLSDAFSGARGGRVRKSAAKKAEVTLGFSDGLPEQARAVLAYSREPTGRTLLYAMQTREKRYKGFVIRWVEPPETGAKWTLNISVEDRAHFSKLGRTKVIEAVILEAALDKAKQLIDNLMPTASSLQTAATQIGDHYKGFVISWVEPPVSAHEWVLNINAKDKDKAGRTEVIKGATLDEAVAKAKKFIDEL
jgi:hypothetical protein